MGKQTIPPVPDSEESALAPPETTFGDIAEYRITGLDESIAEVYVPELRRSYVLKEITPAQFELLHRMGWPHVEKV